MNSTSAVEVSIQAVSPELIFDESTENGALGAAGAASEAAAAADAGAAALASAPGADAAAAGAAAGAEAAAAPDALSANAAPIPPANSEAAIAKDINNLRIFRFPLVANFWNYRASAPVSPVRIRMTCSIGVTKILPSPIFPVRAARSIASMA